MKTQLKLLFCFASVLLSIKGFNQGSNLTATTPDIKVQSAAFKSLSGQDRLSQFKILQKNIIMNDGAHQQAIAMGFNFSTKTSITNLFGTPDKVTDGGFWLYMLKDSQSTCKVVFGFDKTAQVIFCTIKDCD